MSPFLGALFTKFGAYALMALAAIGAVTAVLAGARNAGRNAQIFADQKKAIEATNARTNIDSSVSSASDDDLAKLRSKWER